MSGSIVDPGLLAALGDFHPDTCTIQQLPPAEHNRDEYGQPVVVWTDLAGHVDLPCRLVDAGGQEVNALRQTYAVGDYVILLQDRYPLIRPKMQALLGGRAYDIQHVGHSRLAGRTRLICRVVA